MTQPHQKKIAALTLGCKVNDYDTQAMLTLFKEVGYEIVDDFTDFAHIYLINTCTVTSLSDKKSRQMIRRAKASNPQGIVVAAGCYAQVSPEEVAAIEGVNIVVGTKDRSNIVKTIEDYAGTQTEIIVEDITCENTYEELKIESMGEKTRGFVKIQDGCNEFCSYCIIPHARGRSRSRDLANIVDEVSNLVAVGYKEIVLTGIHLTSYGKDLNSTSLIDVLQAIHNIPELMRIRLGSIEPRLITQEFATAITSLPKVCDHFHLSLQSGCDKTLKAMNRKYTTDEYEQAVKMLRSAMPNVAITTDIIVGFPDESDDDFETTVAFVEKIGFAAMHIFSFSAKKGTRAYELSNQINPKVKTERAKLLKNVEEKSRQAFINSQIGQKVSVLYETKLKDDIYEGYSTNYLKIKKNSTQDIKNKVLETTLTIENFN